MLAKYLNKTLGLNFQKIRQYNKYPMGFQCGRYIV